MQTEDDEEAQETGPLCDVAEEETLLGMPMKAHYASWRMGGAPRFFCECFEMGIDVDSFKSLDKLYQEFVRVEKCRKKSK